MNQFKKAKQKLMEQGKDVEQITDLKTAGVKKQPEMNPESTSSVEVKEETIPVVEIKEETIPVNEPVEVPVKKEEIEEIIKEEVKEIIKEEIKKEDVIKTPEPIPVTSDHNVEIESRNIPNNAIPKATIVSNTVKQQIEPPVIVDTPNQESVSNSDVAIEPTISSEKPIQEVKNNLIQDISYTGQQLQQNPISYIQQSQVETMNQPLPQVQQVTSTSDSINYNTVQQPIYTQIPPFLNENIQGLAVTAYDTVKPVAQQVETVLPTVQQVSAMQTNHPAKKSIPNIFSPKDEAKSMRKSLVLKPSSVKKAESYCSKNGGSFNELVQTLLDNFIEDYGL